MQARGISPLSRTQDENAARSAALTAFSPGAWAAAGAAAARARSTRRAGRFDMRGRSSAPASRVKRGSALTRLGLVARLGFGVRRIQARQGHALLDLLHDPGLEPLLLGPGLRHLLDERLRNDDRAVAVRDDDVVREHRRAAAADRLLPADEGEARHRSRRRDAGAPPRQAGRGDANALAHDAVRDERGDPALLHAGAEDVAEDAGLGDPER